jgi:diguanylate cyclase (GGDEF)-like protein
MKFAGLASSYFTALANKSTFLKGNLRWIIFWPIAALAMLLLGWAVLLADLKKDRQEVEQRALQEALSLARNYANNLTRAFDTVDQTLLHIRYEWELSQGQLDLQKINQKKLLHAGSIFQVTILDSNGRALTSTHPGRIHQFFDDAQFFIAQKYAIIDFLYMGETMPSRFSGQQVMHFSRGISRPDGAFDGVVVVTVKPDYFTNMYNESSMGQYGLMALVGDDKLVRATRIGNGEAALSTRAFTQAPYFPLLFGNQLIDDKSWFADQRPRYIGWQQIEGYPLVAIAGLDQDEVLAPYRQSYAASIRNAAFASIALLGFTLIAMVLSMRLAWRKHQLERTQATYRMATEEGHEGFYIAKPICDKSGHMVDFEAVDCNSYGAQLFQQRREGILGKPFSALLPEPERQDLMVRMKQAMDAGFHEGELEVPGEWLGAVRWLHVKMVRSGRELAITMRDISDTKAHVSELERRGNEDALTGLPNRHWIQGYLPQAIEQAKVGQSMVALLFVDLDGFKNINDTLGHAVGDELLRYAAERLKDSVRPHDYVVRLGGDEFVVIVEQLDDKKAVAHLAERIVAAFKEKFKLSQGTHLIGTSIGISIFPSDGMDAGTLLQNADIAMYSVKTAGKGNYSFYEHHLYEALRKRLDREHELRHAVENDEFIMHYQPRFDIKSGSISSMEALVRWQHPVRGLLEPLEFIDLAEETGLILGLGELVLDKVCAQLATWIRTERQVLPVSVNVSPRQFNHGNFTNTVTNCLKRHKLRADLLEIEITESCMMGDSREISASLASLQQMGIKFLIDDFGTGYSSLSQLQRLDFNVLKVDRAFTSEVAKTEEGKVFFTAIITMAHALGMRVVAEGVENEQQIDVLKYLRCDEIQGFYMSKPLPPSPKQSDFAMPVPALA